MNYLYLDILHYAAPEAMVSLIALLVLAVDLVFLRAAPLRRRFSVAAGIGSIGCLLTTVWIFHKLPLGYLPQGMFAADHLALGVKAAVLVLAVFTLFISVDSTFTEHVGEFVAVLLLGAIGMMFLASAGNLLMIFVALELTSLSLYTLTGFDKRNRQSAEAALKYFLFGGMAAAFLLFGLSLVYGLTGELELQAVAAGLAHKGMNPLLIVALVMVMIGFGFKVAAAPFHLWAPDVYQGAPTPAAAFIASGSKVASFFVLAKVLIIGFVGVEGSAGWQHFRAGWVPLLATLAVASVLLGNLAAIAQSNVKRLLAYSAIAHAGYVLLGIMACANPSTRADGLAAVLYYAITYSLTVVGAFGVVAAVERQTGGAQFDDFNGLVRRSPWLSLCMMIFLLSLAGIPPLTGFFGKFYLFAAVVQAGGPGLESLWLVVLAIAMSCVSLYYYLQVLKRIYIVPAPAGAGRVETSSETWIALVVLAVLVLALGMFPEALLGWLRMGAR